MSKFDHVQFVIDDQTRLSADLGTGVSLCGPPPAGTLTKQYLIDAPDTVLAFAMSQLGKPYDISAVLSIGLRIRHNRNWLDPSKWFCSELVAASFLYGDVPLLKTSDILTITPRDLTLSTRLILKDN